MYRKQIKTVHSDRLLLKIQVKTSALWIYNSYKKVNINMYYQYVLNDSLRCLMFNLDIFFICGIKVFYNNLNKI